MDIVSSAPWRRFNRKLLTKNTSSLGIISISSSPCRLRSLSLPLSSASTADEIFSCGNFQKVAPITRIEARELLIGPVTTRARELYWDFARTAL